MFENKLKDKLQERVDRLLELLEEKAPKFIVAREIALVFEAGVGYCGLDVLKYFGELFLWGLRLKSGHCTHCERELEPVLPESFNICSTCKKEADEAMKEALSGYEPSDPN